MMEKILEGLVVGVPAAVAVIVTVIIFMRYIRKRDEDTGKRDEDIRQMWTAFADLQGQCVDVIKSTEIQMALTAESQRQATQVMRQLSERIEMSNKA